MTSAHLTPVEVAERLIGGPDLLAGIVGVNPKAPFLWRRQSGWRDAGDMPPRANRAILAHSDQHGLGLTAEHLIRGAAVAEIDAILAARVAPDAAQVAA